MISVILAALWVLGATATAMLPMERQFRPGVTLLLLAPVLIALLWVIFGPWVGTAALLGFLSMFRNPLRYFGRRGLDWLASRK